MDARERRQQGVTRLIRLHEDDGSFDRAFWAAIPAAKGWSWSGIWRSNTASGRGIMAVNPDFKDLFAALNAARAKYC